MISKANALSELGTLFPKLAEKATYLDDFAAMGSFLSDQAAWRVPLAALEKQLVIAQLARLELEVPKEKKLSEEMKSGGFLAFAWSAITYTPAKDTGGLSKILTNELARFETAHGFTLGGSGKADILIGQAGKEFNDQLRAGRPFKDVGAGADHGESTHRLQWYLTGSGLALQNRLVDLFAEVSRHSALIDGRRAYLWMWLFDRNPPGFRLPGNPFSAADLWDWRAPENMTWALTRDDATLMSDFPILSAVLGRRYLKRTKESAAEYLTRKGDMLDQFRILKKEAEAKEQKAPGGMFYKR